MTKNDALLTCGCVGGRTVTPLTPGSEACGCDHRVGEKNMFSKDAPFSSTTTSGSWDEDQRCGTKEMEIERIPCHATKGTENRCISSTGTAWDNVSFGGCGRLYSFNGKELQGNVRIEFSNASTAEADAQSDKDSRHGVAVQHPMPQSLRRAPGKGIQPWQSTYPMTEPVEIILCSRCDHMLLVGGVCAHWNACRTKKSGVKRRGFQTTPLSGAAHGDTLRQRAGIECTVQSCTRTCNQVEEVTFKMNPKRGCGKTQSSSANVPTVHVKRLLRRQSIHAVQNGCESRLVTRGKTTSGYGQTHDDIRDNIKEMVWLHGPHLFDDGLHQDDFFVRCSGAAAGDTLVQLLDTHSPPNPVSRYIKK